MGSVNRVSCECGYSSTVRVGGNRETYLTDSSFPFYCEKCGLVDVNYRQEIKCPSCQSKDIKQYGKKPISIKREQFPVIQSFDYMAYKNGNLCPKCKKFTLVFGSSEMMFD